jgi:hypothetical protein
VILAAKATPETAQALVDAMPDARLEAMDTAAYESPPADFADRLKQWAA